jgi:hypothetical protein
MVTVAQAAVNPALGARRLRKIPFRLFARFPKLPVRSFGWPVTIGVAAGALLLTILGTSLARLPWITIVVAAFDYAVIAVSVFGWSLADLVQVAEVCRFELKLQTGKNPQHGNSRHGGATGRG